MPEKIRVNYRIGEADKHLLEILAQHYGVSETDVVKLAIRELAKKAKKERQDLSELLKEDKGIA